MTVKRYSPDVDSDGGWEIGDAYPVMREDANGEYVRADEGAGGAEVSYKCADCKNTFLQPPRCATCGAQKLYDNTVISLHKENERLRRELAEARELLREALRYPHKPGSPNSTWDDRTFAFLESASPPAPSELEE